MRLDMCSRCNKTYPKGVMEYESYCSDYCKDNVEEKQKQILALITESNANQNKSLEQFMYYTERKKIVYDVIAKMPMFSLDDLFGEVSRNLRDQIMFEVQAQLIKKNNKLRCPHDWAEFKKDNKRGCKICFEIEDVNGV